VKPDKARDLHERALRIFEREYGPDHVEVARTLTSLGIAWRELVKPDKARDLYVRALRIFCAHYPNGHPHRDVVVRNLRGVAPDLIVLDDGRAVSRPGDAPPTGS
jgi:Tetratricopeptide repeat